jgi:hypothetical protein
MTFYNIKSHIHKKIACNAVAAANAATMHFLFLSSLVFTLTDYSSHDTLYKYCYTSF